MKILAPADLHLDRYFARRMDPFQDIPEDKLRDVAAAHDATFVQKSELIFGRHRLLCCTLWTDFDIYGERSDNLRNAVTQMNDYLYMRVTHHLGDVVTISTPELGALTNTVRLATEAPEWNFGTGALMRNLATRGLL